MKRSTFKRLRKARKIALEITVKTSGAALKLILENGLDANDIKATGKDGSITVGDVRKQLKKLSQ